MSNRIRNWFEFSPSRVIRIIVIANSNATELNFLRHNQLSVDFLIFQLRTRFLFDFTLKLLLSTFSSKTLSLSLSLSLSLPLFSLQVHFANILKKHVVTSIPNFLQLSAHFSFTLLATLSLIRNFCSYVRSYIQHVILS